VERIGPLQIPVKALLEVFAKNTEAECRMAAGQVRCELGQEPNFAERI
jgi:hypothetical protein